ncbi:hypothetical protein CIFAM_17_02570 [Citrobacter farmeri GTC 1319]|nr:hypothetical protein SAML2017_10250 [Salmonella enterica]GAL51313.1 hypothetical protein CIFAM_17_02570 [Citrobacter farmeri GTC 1319]
MRELLPPNPGPFQIAIYNYTLHYIAVNTETHFSTWLLAFLYMAAGLMLAQRIIISASGMRYSEFLKNVRTKLFSKKK